MNEDLGTLSGVISTVVGSGKVVSASRERRWTLSERRRGYWRNAKVEEGRAEVTAAGGVTRQAAKLHSVRLAWMVEEVRKTQLLLEVVSLSRQQLCLKAQEGNLDSEEESNRRKSKRTDETIAVRSGQSSEMEGDVPLCEAGGGTKQPGQGFY